MPVTREQFEAGFTYEGYKAQMTRNQERFLANEKAAQLKADDVAAFKALKPLNVLVLAEDWCGDVVNNVPVLGKLAAESGTLNVRVLLRDSEPGATVMSQYLNRGEFKSIPVVVFLDENFNEVGHWIERPDSVTQKRADLRLASFKANPEFGDPNAPIGDLPDEVRARVMAETARIRDETTGFSNDEVVREWRATAKA
jgi:hypothetical protein